MASLATEVLKEVRVSGCGCWNKERTHSASILDPAVTKSSKGQQETKASLTRTLMVLGTAG